MENTTFKPTWDLESVKRMTNEELLRQYQEIKAKLDLVDTICLTEICSRNLLSELSE